MTMAKSELVTWDKISALKKSNLDALIDQIRHHQDQIDEAKESIKKLNVRVMTALMSADVKTVGVEYLGRDEKGKEIPLVARTTLVPEGETSKFDKKAAWTKLLEAGVKSEVLAKVWKKVTKKEPRSAYVRITWAKTGDGDEGEGEEDEG